MPTPTQAAEHFRKLDFHDDTLIELRVLPAAQRGEGVRSVVEVHLLRCSHKQVRVLRFSGCANLRIAMDFDVLAQNFPANTSNVEAGTNTGQIRNLLESQIRDWGVEYTGTAASPLRRKLEIIEELVFFRVQFFGGAVEVVARDCQVGVK